MALRFSVLCIMTNIYIVEHPDSIEDKSEKYTQHRLNCIKLTKINSQNISKELH